MATPKKRLSPVRSGNRRRNIALTLPTTQKCPSCGSTMVKHQACTVCGHYKGRAVVELELPTLKRK